MGLVKNQLDDSSLLAVEFTCPDPDCEVEIEGEIENASFDWTDDSSADGIGQANSSVSCPRCDAEYTLFVIASGAEKQVRVEGHPDTVVHFHDDTFDYASLDFDYDDYLASFEPTYPDEVFYESLYDIEQLLKSSEDSVARGALLRMLFLQCVVALEAYLSDRIISIIVEDPKRLVALIGSIPDLRDQKPKFIDAAKKSTFAVDTTKAYLQSFSFHDLEKVDKMYKAALGVTLFADEKIANDASIMVKTRHDLVHRNGRDSSGKRTAVSDNDVRRAKALIKSVFDRVEEAYGKYAGYDNDLAF